MANLDYSVAIKIALGGDDGVQRLRDGFVALGKSADEAEKLASELAREINRAAVEVAKGKDPTEQLAAAFRKVGVEEQRAADEARRLSGELAAALPQAVKTDLAFKELGIRSLPTVQAEAQRVREALAQIKANSDILPADRERAVAAFNQRLRELQKEAAEGTSAAGKFGPTAKASFEQADTASVNLGNKLRDLGSRLQGILAVAGLGITVRELSQVADQYANILARLRLVEGSAQGAVARFADLKTVADATGSSLETTATLYTRITQSGAAVGEQALKIVETINQAIQVSGAGAQESEAALRQLIQGLQSGVLRGEEFNSIMEQSPRLARALADGLGVPIGALRQMAAEGRLTTTAVVGALESQRAAIEGEFAQLPLTLGRAAQRVKNSWLEVIGQLDQTRGYSRSAAEALDLLARNLDTLVPLLIAAGKAFAVWKALNFAAELTRIRVEAQATAPAIAAVGAATNAAGAAAGAAGSRFTAFIGSLKAGALVAVIANLKEIGTWIAETVAKMQGYRDATELLAEAEAKEKAAAEASARAKREQAAAAAEAERKALSLSVASQKLVADFDAAAKGGKSAAEALGDLAKALDLSTVTGIQTAVAALDALERKGKITGEQLRAALQGALKDVDLQAFEVEARAAFDASEAGARRLAAALDAQVAEALRRTGREAAELSGGVNRAAQYALNDLDVLIANLDRLRQQGIDVGAALGASLEQALKKATTVAAVEEVISRWKALGDQGVLTGQQLADGLDAARRKLDELKPGINSVAEAYRALGITSQAELAKAADAAREAFNVLREGRVPVEDLQRAFDRYAEAQIKAFGESKKVALEAQAEALGLKTSWEQVKDATDEAGNAGTAAGDKIAAGARAGSDALDETTRKARALSEQMRISVEEATDLLERMQRLRTDSSGFSVNTQGQTIAAAGNTRTSIAQALQGYGVPAEDARSIANQFADSKGDIPYFSNPGQKKYGGSTLSQAVQKAAEQYLYGEDQKKSIASFGTAGRTTAAATAGVAATASAAPTAAAAAQSSRTVTLRIVSSGGTSSVDGLTDAQIDSIIDALRRAGLVSA